MNNQTDKPEIVSVEATTDGLESMISGMGDPNRDKSVATYYTATPLGDTELENGYRFGWIIPKIVDVPATDALRKWRDWSAEADQLALIKKAERKLQLKKKTIEAYTKARLWGGGAIFINTGQDPLKPLNLNLVKKDGIKSLTVFSRTELTAELLVMDPFDENYGKPEYYSVANTMQNARIHYSHLARFNGKDLPDPWNTGGANYGWGDSVIQRVYQAAKNADQTSANIAALVFEANIDVFSIPNFTAKMADKLYEKNMLKRFSLAARGKSIVGTLMHDADEVYERKQINFSQLPEVLKTFMQIVSAAAHMPETKFFGNSAKGMNATGEGDMKNYYDELSAEQELKIEPALFNLDECLIRHALGNRPEDVDYDWTPLEQMSEKEIAEIGKYTAETMEILGRTGLYMPEVLEETGTNQLVQLGVFPGLDNLTAVNRKDFDEDFELGGDKPKTNKGEPVAGTDARTNDAAPRSLYVRRDVKNSAAIVAWAKEQGFTNIKPDMHVTIAYSRSSLDWFAIGEQWAADLTIPAGGARVMEAFGGDANVLSFKSDELEYRHRAIKRAGASYDFDEYQPHITISLGQAPNLSRVTPYLGEIALGPEIFEEIKPEIF